MVHARRKAANRVNKPSANRMPPTNSEKAASANQSPTGRMNEKGVLPEMKVLNPGPPKLPSTFCEPCAIKTAASANRKGIVAHVPEVARIFLSIDCLSLLSVSWDRVRGRAAGAESQSGFFQVIGTLPKYF